MDFDGDENSTRGLVPGYGAIFMSNIATKKLCFKWQIFGLPIAQANFVKQVKAGMLLFLFEFEKRELFGVFRAASDGAMNIIPHAYGSSGMQFPAQVQIEPVWSCIPLSESEFRNAIIDNYITAKKFNFGLSKNQVQILLELFSSRRLDGKMPLTKIAKTTKRVGKRRFDDDMVTETDTLGPGIWGRISYAASNEIPEESLSKFEEVDDDRFSNGDRVRNEHKGDSDLEPRIRCDQPGVYWTKKKKMNNGGRFLTSDATGSEICNDPGERHSGSADVEYYSGKVNSANDAWLSIDDRATKYQVAKDGPAISSEYPRNSFNKGRRVTEDDIDTFMNEMVENKFPVYDGFNNIISTKHQEKSFGKSRLLLDDNRSSVARYSVGNELLMENGHPSVLSTEHLKNSQGKRPSDDRFPMTSRLQNKSFVGDGVVSVRATDDISNSLGRLMGAGDARNLLMSERAETDFHNSSQHFGNSVDKFRRGGDGLGTEHNVDNAFGPNISPVYSREIFCTDKFLSDDGRSRKSDWVEIVPRRRIGPVFSPVITASCLSEQNIFMNSPEHNLSEQSLLMSSIKPKLESDSFLLHDQTQHSSALICLNGPQNCATLYSSSHDAAASKTVCYDPDSPDISYRYSFASVASRDFDPAQSRSSHKGSDENFIPLSNSEDLTQFFETKRSATDYDFAAGNGSVYPHPENGEHHNQSSYRSSSAIMNPGYPERCEMRTPESKGSKEFTSSDPILAFSSFPNGRSTAKITQGYPVESQSSYEIKIPQREGNEAFADKEFYTSCRSRLYYSSSPHDQAKGTVNRRTELYSDTKSDRTSVFSRLSVAREVHIQADKNDTDRVYDDSEPDASVDEMDLLHQAHNHWLKTEHSRPREGDGNIRFKAKSKFHKGNFGQSLVSEKKKEIDASCDVNKNCDTFLKEVCVVDDVKENSDTLQETRVIDFKRRSKVKKWDEKISEGSAGISEGTSILDGKPASLMNKTSTNAVDRGLLGNTGKSRKLIRPDFRRKEYPDENRTVETVPYDRSPVKESPNEMTVNRVQDAHKSSEFTGELSCNGEIAHTGLPAISDDISISEQSPVFILSETSKISEPSTDQDSAAGKELLQDIKIDNTVSQVSPCETNENVRVGLEIKDQVKASIQDILSMIRNNSSAPVSPPVMN